MADFIKSKIIARLAKFTKDLKPQDINLSFLSGKGELNNLELNPNFLNEILELPPWVEFQSAICDNIKAKIHFTKIQSEPMLININELKIKVALCEDQGPRLKRELLFGGPTKYGFTEKVIDGMKIEIKLITIDFDDPIFKLNLSIHDIIIQSKTAKWERAKSLADTRIKNEEEDYVILFKEIKLASIRISGESAQELAAVEQGMPLKLIMSETTIRVAYKRRISTSAVMYTRFVLRLGDMVLILTQSQLKGTSLLIQSVIRRGLDSYHKEKKRKQEEKEKASLEERERRQQVSSSSDKKPKKTSPPKKNVTVVDASTPKEVALASRERHRLEKLEEKLKQYQDGYQQLPMFEVVQNSFHVRTGRLDIQFCDDVNRMTEGGVNSSLLMTLEKFNLDLYLDQKAYSGRKQWAGCNRILLEQVRWARSLKADLMEQQNKRPESDTRPRIHLDKLHEIGIKFNWQNFKIDAVTTTTMRNATLPLLRSDKATFNIPDDREYPAVQVNITIYHYPDVYGSMYLAPRPNIYVYCCPIHINFDQKTCVWAARFVRAILGTIDTHLATSVKNDLIVYLDKLKQTVPKETDTSIMPGADVKVQVLFSKVTIPLNPETFMNNQKVNLDDGRPKALQVETSEINIVSMPIGCLSNDTSFNSTLKSIKSGWLFSNAHADNFPHEADVDGNVVPNFLEKLLSTGFHNFILSPGDAPTCEEVCFTSWNLEIRCICVSFIHEMSELGVTHDTKPFVPDFPLNVWLFENLSNTKAKSFVPVGGTFKPKFHVIVDIPSMISAAINHLQLLFLMRLGDSLNKFQLMMEEIFTFKSNDEGDGECLGDPTKRARSHSIIMARKNQQITDVEFEFTGCVLIKRFDFTACLPVKVTPKLDHPPPVFMETEDTPTHQPKCKILLKAPTRDESDVLSLVSQQMGTISGPISVSPDPGLQYALQRSLPGTPRILTPRSQSPSLESMGTPTSLSHSASLASMNIDDAVNQFCEYQEDDYFIIDTKVTQITKTFTEKVSVTTTSQGSSIKTAGGLPCEGVSAGSQDNKAHPSHITSQLINSHNQIAAGDEMIAGSLESFTSDKSSNEILGQGVTPSDSTQQTTTQPQKYPPPANLQNQIEIGKEDIPESSDSSVQVKFSNDYPTEEATLVTGTLLTTDSTTQLENDIPKEDTLTMDDINVSKSFSSIPAVKEIHWQLQVTAFNICAIPIVNSTGLIAKLAAGRIDLKEIPMSDSTDTLSQKEDKPDDIDEDYDLQPSIRGRIELGPRIYKYYPTLEELHIPCVVQLYVNGVNASLLLSLMENLALMFEDEIKASIPVPLYIILEGNQFLILEKPDGHAGDFSTLDVSVNKVCIQRGPEVPKLAIWKTELLTGEPSRAAMYRETTPLVSSTTPVDLTKSSAPDKLLNSIRIFTSGLQPEIEKLGSSSHVQRINQALLELQNAAGITSEQYEPPPRYSESVDYDNTAATITSLREQIESLQKEQQQLQDQIKRDQEQLKEKDSEMAQLVGDLVKSKDSEVAMKEVVFRLNNQIQDVVMENDQLKVTMARAGLRVPVSKKL